MSKLLLIPKHATQFFINGPTGKLDCLELKPSSENITGIAIIFHPDPKAGGNYTNKIVKTIATTLNKKNYICYCPNLRGVGLSEGKHDNGIGEVDDAITIYTHLRTLYPNLPIVLAGFSFGTSIASQLASQIDYKKLILIAPAVTRYKVIISNYNKTIVMHGENDDVVELTAVLDWARINKQPVIWLPNTDHFFHGKLLELQNILEQYSF